MLAVVHDLDLIAPLCRAVGALCRAVGCERPGELCIKAGEAGTEEEWKRWCEESMKACSEQRAPQQPPSTMTR